MSASESTIRLSRTRAPLAAFLLITYGIGISTGLLVPQLVRSSSPGSAQTVAGDQSGTTAAAAYQSLRQGERSSLDLTPAAAAYQNFRQGERAP
jgi:hypothetical protein